MSRAAEALRRLLGTSTEVNVTQLGARYIFSVSGALLKEAREALAEHDRGETNGAPALDDRAADNNRPGLPADES
jgi:hypothetical protein